MLFNHSWPWLALLWLIRNSCIAEPSIDPVSVAPSQYWDGDDGSWSSFAVQVGTPPQDVRVLVSSSGSALWVVLPEGCIATDPSDCPRNRGFTFLTNESSTWTNLGLFSLLLAAEEPLGYFSDDNSDLGTDNITLGWQGSHGPAVSYQLVAGIATKDFYLGLLGVTNRPYNVSNFNNEYASPLETLYKNNQIPSLAWGYTAGASYRENAYGSLVLGGYDASRTASERLSVWTSADDTRDLVVNILSITSGDSSLLPNAIPAYIDSTVSHIWLPVEACHLFEQAFGLQLDNLTQLYLLNDSQHNTLLSNNASITFELGPVTGTAKNDSQPTINITLPYASFDLTATYPFVGEATGNESASSWYFPLRQAANSTQYTLGRTFLQEAYLTVDYGRANFSISQAAFLGKSTLVGISSPGSVDAPSEPQWLSIGAIAGIVVGTIAAPCTIAAIIWFLVKKHRNATHRTVEAHELPAGTTRLVVAVKEFFNLGHKAELSADNPVVPKELPSPDSSPGNSMSPNPSELAGSPPNCSELASSPMSSWQSNTAAVTYEMPGDRRRSAELVGSEPSPKGLGLIEEHGNESK